MIEDQDRRNGQWGLSRREFLHLAAGVAIAVLLPGCDRPAPPTPPALDDGWVKTDRYKKDPPWRLGRATRGDMSSWQVMLSAHIEYGAREKYGQYFSDYRFTAANWDADKQIQDIRGLLTAGIDALVIDSWADPTIIKGLQQAMDAGVPVIVLSTALQDAPYVTWITPGEEERGAACADWLAGRISGGRVIVLQGEPAIGESSLWLKGVRRLESRPGFSLEVATSYWLPSEARKVTDSLLNKSSDIQGLVVNSGTVAQGAVEACSERGMAIPPVAGADDCNGWLRTARQQGVSFLGFGGHALMGLRCVELAMDILSGKAVQAHEEFPYQVFDETALDRYYRPDLSDHFWAIQELPEPWLARMFKL